MIQGLKQVEKTWIDTFQINKKNASSKKTGIFSFIFFSKNKAQQDRALRDLLKPWQMDILKNSNSVFKIFQTKKGSVHVHRMYLGTTSASISFIKSNHKGALSESRYGFVRDHMGLLFRSVKSCEKDVVLELFDAKAEDIQALLVGLEISSYSFKNPKKIKLPQLVIYKNKGQISKKEINSAQSLGSGVNIARHLVNLPSNLLHPKNYGLWIKSHFQKLKNTKVEIWEATRLKKENMGLFLSVGEGAKESPLMARITYTPTTKKTEPLVFVGKGVTFDSGGLNIKPTSGIRNMKKDMGGSASVLGLAHWAITEQVKKPIVFYVGICENAISKDAFRPGDIVQSRNGLSIEIDNTDAEGRLVLADVIDVAVTQKQKPEVLVDVATLTGAIKAALGADVAGYFSNDDGLSKKIESAIQNKSEPSWRMPLYQRQRAKFASSVADMTNAVNGFGGAMNAAIFLETFVRKTPWVHFDIYAWKDSPSGCYLESGGNGQLVQALSDFISNY